MKRLLTTELLLLPDGRVLVHNLTRTFAELLCECGMEWRAGIYWCLCASPFGLTGWLRRCKHAVSRKPAAAGV